MPDTYRVLVTGAGTTTAVSVLKGLRAANDPSLRILMGDVNPDCAGAHLGDEFVRMPPARAADFGERAVSVCKEHGVDLVIPVIDLEFLAWSAVAGQLRERGTQVAISSTAALERCIEKDKTFAFFQSLDVPAIPTWRADEVKEPAELPYPVYIKPRCGRASLDNYRVDNLDEYQLFIRKVHDAIVQPFIRGVEVTIDTISDLHGRFLAAAPRVRVEIKSGQAYRSRTFASSELTAQAQRIVEGLPITGAANIQCFMTDEGVRFFEINARFGAGTALSIYAGMNGPLALVATARGRPLPELAARPGVLMMRYWQEVFAEGTR
jgi:carbamoyl-phosphate synthase large subunit